MRCASRETPQGGRFVLRVLLTCGAVWGVCHAQTARGSLPETAVRTDEREAAPLLLRSIDSLSNLLDSGHTGSVVLRGVVTLVRSQIIYVQDQTGAIAVIPPEEPSRLAIGDEVELQGKYRRRELSSAIYATKVRRLWSGSPPVPLSLNPAQAAEGSFGNHLIDTEGRLLKKTLGDGYLRLTFEGDSQLFGASLELSSPIHGSRDLGKRLEEGSTLRLVGVCVSRVGSDEAGGNAFLVLLRSTDDIREISPPPWWNLKHTVWLGCAALILISLVYLIRDRVVSLRYQVLFEERGRMAREMHDSLAQGFSGLTYQLEGLARELNASVEKESLERHLGLALQLVRHCREEAHRSIFALRSLTQMDADLLSLLMSSCESMGMPSGIRVAGVREGKPTLIPDETMNHLLRIGQEAIANAWQHSGASEILVTVRFGEADVTLSVADNGRGFDVSSAKSAETGHFGILGMKERVKHIDGRFEIASTPETGTTVTVRAAATRRRSRHAAFGWRPGWIRPQGEGSKPEGSL